MEPERWPQRPPRGEGKVQTSRIAAVVGLLTCVAPLARAGDLIDTRLSFVFADDNVLAKAGETNPNSPNARFGAGNQNTQFYDNFNTRFSGFETLSHVVLYKKAQAFFEGLTTEASLNVLLLERSSGGIDLRDDSSYINLNYRPRGWGEREGLTLTGFPVSADRFRLGYAYRLTWGGSSVFTNRAAANGVPGVKLQLTRDRWYAFAGAKTALVLNDLILEQETLYGALGGVGVDVLDILRLEANGGYFQKGLVPGLASQGIEAHVNSAGVSAQAVLHVGVPVGTSVDLRLYRNDPEMVQKFFSPETYPGGFSYSVSLEGDLLYQTLEDPDRFAATTPQQARAAALQVRTKWNYLRAHLLGLYRTLSYIQFDTPGFPPFKDLPTGHHREARGVRRRRRRLPLPAAAPHPGLHRRHPAAGLVQQPADAARRRERAAQPRHRRPHRGGARREPAQHPPRRVRRAADLLGEGDRPLGSLGVRRDGRRGLLHARPEPDDVPRRRHRRGRGDVRQAGRDRLQRDHAGALLGEPRAAV